MTQLDTLVTILGKPSKGKNSYERRLYIDPHNKDNYKETDYYAEALVEFIHPRNVVVLCTKQVENTWYPKLETKLRAQGVSCISKRITALGGDETEARLSMLEQFKEIKEALSPALHGEKIAIDITHGYRSIALTVSAVAAFMRFTNKDHVMFDIYYGAKDSVDDTEPVPTWNLSWLMDLMAWGEELSLFLRTGRAETSAGSRIGRTDLVTLIEKTAKDDQQGVLFGTSDELRTLAGCFKDFSGDLETVRTGSLLLGKVDENGALVKESSAKGLRDAVRSYKAVVDKLMHPLSTVLEQVENMVEKLVVDEPHYGLKGHNLQAVAALAELYVGLGRFAEAITTTHEGSVNAKIKEDGPEQRALTTPGEAQCNHITRTDDAIAHLNKGGTLKDWQPPEKEKFDPARSWISKNPRNDLNHAGYRPDPLPYDEIRDKITKRIAEFRDLSNKRHR